MQWGKCANGVIVVMVYATKTKDQKLALFNGTIYHQLPFVLPCITTIPCYRSKIIRKHKMNEIKVSSSCYVFSSWFFLRRFQIWYQLFKILFKIRKTVVCNIYSIKNSVRINVIMAEMWKFHPIFCIYLLIFLLQMPRTYVK